jgi:hypothetical protein
MSEPAVVGPSLCTSIRGCRAKQAESPLLYFFLRPLVAFRLVGLSGLLQRARLILQLAAVVLIHSPCHFVGWPVPFSPDRCDPHRVSWLSLGAFGRFFLIAFCLIVFFGHCSMICGHTPVTEGYFFSASRT